MASINLKLDTRKAKKNGTFPIKLFIWNKRSMAYISANISVPENYWDNGRIKLGCIPTIERYHDSEKIFAFTF